MSIRTEKQGWKQDIGPFEHPDLRKSLWQVVTTLVPFVLLWSLAYLSLSISIWIALVLTVPAAGFAVRTFVIFHDCCHGSLFRSRRANEVVGIITGIATLFPYYQWKREHAIHHATSGNLTKKGIGDIWTLTVEEYLASSKLRQIGYRLYRNPLILFGLGPLYMFLVNYRMNNKGAGTKEKLNTYATNLLLAVIFGGLCVVLGWKQVLLIEGAILYLSGIFGIWLFYVQHQFESTYFEREENWNYYNAALHGSSFYKLPKVLEWITGNIGYHHIHHLSSRIPNYNLPLLYNRSPQLQQIPHIGILSSLRSLKFKLWDEAEKKFVGFREAAVTPQRSRISALRRKADG